MTVIAKDLATKLAIAMVAVAMVFTAFTAKAETSDDLEAQIADLLKQVAALQSELGDEEATAGAAASVCPYTWTRDLKVGATGADVMKLQKFLNADPDTRVAATGTGSAGMETEYYGPATGAAVAKYQTKYRADILTPAGLVSATQFFGPATRAYANAHCTAGSTGDDEDDSSSTDLSGEASLDKLEVSDAEDDTIYEGDEDVAIAEVKVEFVDGDAEISRMDISVNGTSADNWDAFESFSLWVDGDKIAEAAADSKSDYLGDEDDGVVRFTDLNLVAEEDEEVVVTVAATVQSNLDSAELTDYDVQVESVRYFDADEVATTDESTDGINTDTATVTIDEAGAEDELVVKSSTNDPDAATLQVEDDAKSDWYTVFTFDLDTDDSTNDITLNEVPVTVVVSTSTFDGLVDDYELVIDGTTIDDADYTNGTTTVLTFNVDGDVTIDAGERVEAELRLKFNSLATAYEGATVLGKVTTTNATAIDAEGSDDLATSQLSGSATGETHTLRTGGLSLELTSITETESIKSVSSTDYEVGTYVFKFEVTAFGDDFYMDENADIIDYDLLVGGVEAAAASSTAVLDIVGADDAATADYMIADGETATFTLTVETATSVDGASKVVINEVQYSTADDATEESAVDATPADDWTSDSLILN